MKSPLVSVVIPNYNHAQFLDERIQSVLNQTYQNFEIIILDDKSTDNSVEVINKYKDNPHVSEILVNEENSGSTFKQWHRGFELAKGDIVWIAESDDSCDEKLLEVLVKGYVENNAVLAFCKSYMYDVEGNKLYYGHQGELIENFSISGSEFISAYMIKKNIVANASSVIFDKKIALTLDKQYMSMRAEGDWLFWIELMEHGNVCFCNSELNLFRFHPSNTSLKLLNKGLTQIEHKIVFDYLATHNYIPSSDVKNEKIRLVNMYSRMNYESRSTRREVLNAWDKNRCVRLYIIGSMIKNIFLNLRDMV